MDAHKFSRLASVGILLLTLFSANSFALHKAPSNPIDPLESFNRVSFQFNEKLDEYVIKPPAVIYKHIVPSIVRTGVTNFFNNFGEVPTIINGVLQLKFYQALSDSWRLLINSTVGIGGVIDVGSHIGLEKHHEDLGLTLARYGYKKSMYIVIPVIGPSTFRDGVTLPINFLYLSVWPYLYPLYLRYALFGLDVVNTRANLLQPESVLDEAALDPYIVLRDAYLQRRAFLMGDYQETEDLYVEAEGDLGGADLWVDEENTAKPSNKGKVPLRETH